MKVKEAAHRILQETGKPLLPDELARQILDRKMASSNSKKPVNSVATTITKTIRDGVYNEPEMAFFHTSEGRLIGLPEWKENGSPKNMPASEKISLSVPGDLMRKVLLAEQAEIAESLEKTILVLIQEGLASIAPDVKKRIRRQLKDFDDE